MHNYLQLVRYKNLIIILFLQWVMHACVIKPVLLPFRVPSATPEIAFWLLVLSTILIAAGGYIVNDYFDVKIDEINRPDKVIVGKNISKKSTMRLYQICTIIGLCIGIGLAIWVRNVTFGFLFVAITGLLWFYSASYKRQFLVGNLIVGVTTALVPFMVGLLEVSFLHRTYGELLDFTPVAPSIFSWINGFALFAFLVTLIREVVKDMEDVEGDREMECRTMPIVWGISRSKWVVYGLVAVVIAAAGFYVSKIHFANDTLTMRYYILGIVVPFIYFFYLIIRAKQQSSLHQAAGFLKFIMVVGICYSFVFYFLQARAYGFPLFDLFMINQPAV
ncbi:geranylgeranylglycerol-phosphate geranylgeranyltransferase [Paludibacter jiangxiensis]|uniref:4-hydroxybenzoate polyprenyltransferase n=1 Tax=Paludibacter jiangxiensis TaxID=681398 RepID=A0A161LEU9_9BACT|nr:geranylgeranylglycerol-phosphate geranylgeranyltransferase [Paludibacter jiangxiensis]GAT63315.1 4-hydroxybenzoate polyprenyltransferase [Paludibacter jiangxiensis]